MGSAVRPYVNLVFEYGDVSVKEAQDLARHSTADLTLNGLWQPLSEFHIEPEQLDRWSYRSTRKSA